MKWVYLVGNAVVDRVQVDPKTVFTSDYASKFIEAPDEVDHGWTNENGQWIAPPPVELPKISVSVTPLQASIALLNAGKLDAVETYMASASADPVAKLAWQKAVSFERDSPLLLQIATQLKWSEKDLDDLFDAALLVKV